MEISYTLQDINEAAGRLLKEVTSRIILFDGPMGVGKTTLIKALTRILGVSGDVSSPTYSIVNEYQGKEGMVYHFDFYRIEDESEAYDLGFEDYFIDDSWLLIEWPERVSNLLPEDAVMVKMEFIDKNARKLVID